VAKDFSILRKK